MGICQNAMSESRGTMGLVLWQGWFGRGRDRGRGRGRRTGRTRVRGLEVEVGVGVELEVGEEVGVKVG